MTEADWAIFLSEPYVDELYPRQAIVRPLFYCEQDQPSPSLTEMQHRLKRDRALQQWHTSTDPRSFEQYFSSLE